MLRDLSSNKLRHLASACAQQVQGITFTADNGPHGAFELAHLPMSDTTQFVQALVAHARSQLGSSISLSFARAVAFKGSLEPEMLGHLENAFALELAAADIHAVRVSVERTFCSSIGELCDVRLVGVRLTG